MRPAATAVTGLLLLCAAGCLSRPGRANIELRRREQTLQAQINLLQRQHAADQATIAGMKNLLPPTATAQNLNDLFLVSKLKIARLTGITSADPSKHSAAGLEVHVVPIDSEGDKIKAAGSFAVEVRSESSSDTTPLASWNFSVEVARKCWYGSFLLYEYVLPCPWAAEDYPRGDLKLHVVFHDALTQRQVAADSIIKALPN